MSWRRKREENEGDYATFCLNPSEENARRLTTSQLHDVLAERRMTADAASGMAESEIRRREAWASPNGWAIYVSTVAALIALGALLVSLFKSP